ncbi:hypothetical protein V2W23_14365, partial [Staphylococcus gallinarum]
FEFDGRHLVQGHPVTGMQRDIQVFNVDDIFPQAPLQADDHIKTLFSFKDYSGHITGKGCPENGINVADVQPILRHLVPIV